MKHWLSIGLFLISTAPLAAQAERFELGQRLREFEAEFEKQTDPAARQRAVPSLKQTVWVPFSVQPGLAAQKLDQARHALRAVELPPAEQRWAESLWLTPASRFLDARAADLTLTLRALYPANLEAPKEARLRVTLGAHRVEAAIGTLPQSVKLPLAGTAAADHILKAEVLLAGRPLVSREIMISRTDRQAERLAALNKAVASWPAEVVHSERETVRYLAELLQRLANGESLETNYPAHRLLAEAEAAVKALNDQEAYYTGRRPGEFWLSLAVQGRPVPLRMLVPPVAARGAPVPLVVALHGASGSENLFFEGYGRGAIVKLCQERGWLLAAPRLSAFGGSLPVAELVDEVARLYPVSRKHVYLVGHSMGAAQAVLNTSKTPERFAAVAALGGGGLVRGSDVFKSIPFFVGVGSDDFALSWARNLHQNLQKAGVEKLAFREYPGIEHIAIAQVALGDVFRWLDEVGKAK